MPETFELSGPAAVVLMVRDPQRSAAFYTRTLGFRRDPQVFPNGAIGFLTYPVPFGVVPAPPGVDLDAVAQPGLGVIVWLKTADARRAHDALVEAGVTIARPPTEGRFGRQFTFADPDGYAITIYDRDEPPAGWENAGQP
jgi:catechol 2,3-dioxygenase-like lactoylglutathione lyase family enzyme